MTLVLLSLILFFIRQSGQTSFRSDAHLKTKNLVGLDGVREAQGIAGLKRGPSVISMSILVDCPNVLRVRSRTS